MRFPFRFLLIATFLIMMGTLNLSSTWAESALHVKSTNQNYYLATLINESDFYDPTFFNDYILTVQGRDLVHFTRVDGEVIDYYFYEEDMDALSAMRDTLKAEKEYLNSISTTLYSAFLTYRTTQPEYQKEGLYNLVAVMLKELTHTTVQRVVGNSQHHAKIDAALYQYLRSNGIEQLEDIQTKPDLINMLVNKFFMLSTTYFYRDAAFIHEFTKYLEPLKTRLAKDNTPFKAKVFACSTGEEVLTYAIELLENGIEDFRILATDINDAGLEHARNMRYSGIAMERLPLKTRQKILKYFIHDTKGDIYYPKDPEFFKTRILYQNQDILQDLPDDLTEEFSPPYDLVSILNVLLYLENKAVQERKEYWKNLLNPNGFLILHDAQFSIARGSLDADWGMKNFLTINEFVNIRAPKELNQESRLKFYQDQYDDDNEVSFKLLERALSAAGSEAEASQLTESYLIKHPLSYKALTLAYAYQLKEGRDEIALETLHTLLHAYPYQMGTLNHLIASKNYEKDKAFLQQLRQQFLRFLKTYRQSPDQAILLFDFAKPKPHQLEPLRLLFKASGQAYLAKFHIKQKELDAVKKSSMTGLDYIIRLYQEYPEYIAAGKFLNELVTGLVTYHMDEGQTDQALAYCDRGLEMFEEGFRNKNYFYILEGLGQLHLKKSVLLQQKGQMEASIQSINDSVFYYEQAQFLLQDLFTSKHSYFYGNIGHSYLLRGRNFQSQGKEKRAKGDFRKAFQYLESGLERNPLYGKEIAKLRAELIDLAAGIDLQLEAGKNET